MKKTNPITVGFIFLFYQILGFDDKFFDFLNTLLYFYGVLSTAFEQVGEMFRNKFLFDCYMRARTRCAHAARTQRALNYRYVFDSFNYFILYGRLLHP